MLNSKLNTRRVLKYFAVVVVFKHFEFNRKLIPIKGDEWQALSRPFNGNFERILKAI